jgi:hypothetical protein
LSSPLNRLASLIQPYWRGHLKEEQFSSFQQQQLNQLRYLRCFQNPKQ